MIYIPNPKALVYNELNFISMVGPRPHTTLSVDEIFDEVSNEIFALFIAKPVSLELTTWEQACDAVLASEVLN